MHELTRLLMMIGAAGVVLTVAGGVFIWFIDETRRLRRGLAKILGAKPHGLLTAPGKGRGLGLNFANNTLAVAWNTGAWGLVYRMEELSGAEVVVDGKVAARVHRDEDRRALEQVGGATELVRLRLIFDDAAWPDFDLDLWTPESVGRRGALTAAGALKEANRWLATAEAILRRAQRRPEPAPRPVPPIVETPPPPRAEPERQYEPYIDPDEALS